MKNRNVVIEFLSILSLIVTILVYGVAFVEDDLGIFLLCMLTFPFLLWSIGKSIHFFYKLFAKKEVVLWEKILIPLFLVIFLANFSPVKPTNYQVCWCNPKVRMVAYVADLEAWRGGEAFVFRSDSMVEYRLAYRDSNGSVREVFPYSRRKDTIFFRNDTIFRNDTLLIKGGEMDNPRSKKYKSMEILFDKDIE